jgi:hypothetical protein
MLREDVPETGWGFVAAKEGAAEVFGALLALEPDAERTKTELAEDAGVALKTLYVNDWLSELVDLGVLAETGENDDGETCYRVVEDSDLLVAARRFDEAYRTASD